MRPLVATAVISFLAGHVYLVMYIFGAASGETAAQLVRILYGISVVVPWVLGCLAVRAAGRKRVGWAFLFAAPWPVLAIDLITVSFSRFLGTYLVMAVAAAVIGRLAWRFASQAGRVHATVRVRNECARGTS